MSTCHGIPALSGSASQFWMVVAPPRNIILDLVQPDPVCIPPNWSNPRQQRMHTRACTPDVEKVIEMSLWFWLSIAHGAIMPHCSKRSFHIRFELCLL